jgi:hypothetical protein
LVFLNFSPPSAEPQRLRSPAKNVHITNVMIRHFLNNGHKKFSHTNPDHFSSYAKSKKFNLE